MEGGGREEEDEEDVEVGAGVGGAGRRWSKGWVEIVLGEWLAEVVEEEKKLGLKVG